MSIELLSQGFTLLLGKTWKLVVRVLCLDKFSTLYDGAGSDHEESGSYLGRARFSLVPGLGSRQLSLTRSRPRLLHLVQRIGGVKRFS